MSAVKSDNGDGLPEVIAWLESLVTDVAALNRLVSALQTPRGAHTGDDPVGDGMVFGESPGAPHRDGERSLTKMVRYESLQSVLAQGLSALSDRPDILLDLLVSPELLRELQELVFVEGGPYWDRPRGPYWDRPRGPYWDRPRGHDEVARIQDYLSETGVDDAFTADVGAFLSVLRNSVMAAENGERGYGLAEVIVWLERLITDIAALDKLTSVLEALRENSDKVGSSGGDEISDTLQVNRRYAHCNGVHGCDAWFSRRNGIPTGVGPMGASLTTLLDSEALRSILAVGLSELSGRPEMLLELLVSPVLLRELQELVFVEGGPYWDRTCGNDTEGIVRDDPGEIADQAANLHLLLHGHGISKSEGPTVFAIDLPSELPISSNGSGTADKRIVDFIVGADVSGTEPLANPFSSVYVGYWGNIRDAASGTNIGVKAAGAGNVISANASCGVGITGNGVPRVVVDGNKIGTDTTGSYTIGNSDDGVQIDSGTVSNTIGGTSQGAGNLFDGNGGGVDIIGPGTNNIVAVGNQVGTDAAGTETLGNDSWGVYVQDSADDTVNQNLISGNDQGGLAFRGIDSQDELVRGNYIGTDVTGNLALGNAYSGIYVGDWGVSGDAASDVTISGTSIAAGNVISANRESDVRISGSGTTGVVVDGNWIGTDVTGSYAIRNAYTGVQVDSGFVGYTMGGTGAGAGNVIPFNDDNGVTVGQNVTEGNVDNAILQNSIFGSSLLGVDLGDNGVRLNGSEGHSGPNLFQDFPVLSSALTADDTMTVQFPDQSGQNLAWSLAPIQGYDRESVALTVNLPAIPSYQTTPFQIDSGASAYATLDADTNDPFIQEEAAKLSYDPQQIFDYLHNDIGYNSYLGSVRGGRGTLWSNAGNALDVASLGLAFMRASGIPAQYVSGTLSQSDAQKLILLMFPATYQTVGHFPSITQVSDPANDPQLLSETEAHYWFQFDTASRMTDADPLMPGATIGRSFTTSRGTFTVVPDNLEEKTEVQLVAEMYSQASALFGLSSGLQDTTVLDQTFDHVQLVGHPLTIGNNVSTGGIFPTATTTYSPYIEIGDEAHPNPSEDELIHGQDYQEFLTGFPLSSQILTGPSLNANLSGPDGPTESYERDLADWIGFAARQGLISPSISSFLATVLNANGATVTDASGKTIGSGVAALSSAVLIAVAVAGKDQHAVSGTGSLSFYGPSGSALGVCGDWQNYTPTVTGNVSIALIAPDGALTLSGQALPAGTYTIATNSATLLGGGTMSSPNFAGTDSITATDGTINLGPGSGTLAIGGKPLDSTDETTLDGYTGTINVSANGDGTDSVVLNGNAGNVLQVTASLATPTTDQNTPITFPANVQTSHADRYNLTASARPGWSVTIDSKGNVTATPAPGLQSGTYPIQIIAQSPTDANLVARTTVDVTIKPTRPSIYFAVIYDPIFTVPYNGAQLPTAFRANIQNLGPAADTYNLTFSNIPSGFTLLNSGTSVTVPAGATGILGIYLVPNTGQPIPPPGTQLSFTVTAITMTDSSITQSQTEMFTVPDIDAVSLASSPTSLSSTPGTPAMVTLTLRNDGNVSETETLMAATPAGLTAGSLAPITIALGATQTETLTPDGSAALNQMLATTITVGFGPSSAPVTTTAALNLLVRSAQTVAVSQAAIAAGLANNSQLSSVLTDLGNTLAALQTATSAALSTEVQTDLTTLNALLNADPALASLASQVQPLINDARPDDLTELLANVTGVLSQEASEQFTAGLLHIDVDLQPDAGQALTVTFTNIVTDAETLNLSERNLTSGATVQLGHSPRVTSDPEHESRARTTADFGARCASVLLVATFFVVIAGNRLHDLSGYMRDSAQITGVSLMGGRPRDVRDKKLKNDNSNELANRRVPGSNLETGGDTASHAVSGKTRRSDAAIQPDPRVALAYSPLRNVSETKAVMASFQKALDFYRKTLRPDHPDVAIILSNLGLMQRDLHEYAAAEASFQEALAISRKALPPGHPGVATILSNLGMMQRDLHEYAAAKASFQEALAISRKALPPGHPDVAASLYNLELVQRELQDYEATRNGNEGALAKGHGSQAEHASPAPASDIVVTDTGAPLKILVSHDSALYAVPDRKGDTRPVKALKLFDVLCPEKGSREKLKNGFYRVASGRTEENFEGWISKDDVVEWPHRQVLGFRPRAGRDPVRFYRSLDDLKTAYQLGSDKGPEPISIEQAGSEIALMPILDRFTFKCQGDDVVGYQVAYVKTRPGVGGKWSSGGAGSETAIDLSKTTLDVVFVIDTTYGMQPFIDATKQVIKEISGELAKEKSLRQARFGLVAYRDTISNPPPDWYVTKLVCDLKTGADHAAFLKNIDDMDVSGFNSDDTPEDVLAGLRVAIQEMDWNPSGFKHIILIGDSSAHDDDRRNSQKATIEGLLSLAQPTGRESLRQKIAIHSIRIAGSDPADHARCEDQFTRIGQGRDYPGKHMSFGSTDTPAFIAKLLGILSKAAVGLDLAKNGMAAAIPKDTPGFGLLVDMIAAGTESTSGAPTFVSGFVCEVDRMGHEQVEPLVLVQYGQLELLYTALDYYVIALKNAGEPRATNVKTLLQSMQALAAQVNVGEPVDPNASPATILKYVLGFPVRNKIDAMSLAMLAAMPESDYENWVKEFQASRSIIKGHLDNREIWFSLGNENTPEKRYGFIKVTDLP
jgi:tetratricopeptide (TPR) repeat protein